MTCTSRGIIWPCLVALTLLLGGCGGGASSDGRSPAVSPSPADPWQGLQGTSWAVPVENLRAYTLPQGTTQPVRIAEQMVLTFAQYTRGYLLGTATVALSTSVAGTGLGPTPQKMSLVGSVTPEGSVRLYLTASGVSTIQLLGTLAKNGSAWTFEAQSVTMGTSPVMQMARFRMVATGESAVPVSNSLRPDPATDTWAFLKGVTFYVPLDNLLAWVLGPKGTPQLPIQDQTTYTLADYDQGYYWGPTQVTMSVTTGVGHYGATPSDLTLLGSVTPSGRVLLSFTPTDAASPPVTGYGLMQLQSGQWTMLNQMASGGTPSILHWAYMLQLPAGGTPPSPQGPPDVVPVSSRWSFLRGTSWYVPDPWLPALATSPGRPPLVVADQTRYSIQTFIKGYFFGATTVQLTAPDGTTSVESLDLAGSVTPPGGLYLAFTPGDGSPATIGLGQMRSLNGQASMENQMTSGDNPMLTHWAYMLSQ